MTTRSPRLVWVEGKEIPEGNWPVLDELLRIPGNNGYIGRNLLRVRGNSLRGREQNQNTLDIGRLMKVQGLSPTNRYMAPCLP